MYHCHTKNNEASTAQEAGKNTLEVRMKEMYGIDIQECPCCKKAMLQLLVVYVPWKQADDG
ncbi:MAG: hypothetical protein IT249_00045 [Chitinophagaceae bacterium]|nr:hypothetical protein [Chitinophagaceae bacterium]